MTHRIGLVVILGILLAACAPVMEITPIVLPTVADSGVTPTQPTPSGPASASPTPEPSATPQPPPDYFLTPTADVILAPATTSAVIQIHQPGPLSKVVSPIKLRGYVIPGAANHVRLELFGEDGRLLARKILVLYTIQTWAFLSVDLPFEVHAAGELGRLTISTEDQYGRTNALTSFHLLLLSVGSYEINPPGNLDERCILNFPQPASQIAGGTLLVDGEIRPFNAQPLVIELVASDNVVVGSRQVEVRPVANDGYVSFTTDVPYVVSVPTAVRLTVRQEDDRIGGTMYLYSQEILLNP